MAVGDLKDLTRGTASDKRLRDKAFIIAKNLNYDGYQRGLASLFYKFFDEKSSGVAIKNENMPNQDLANQLDKILKTKSISGVLIFPICN